MSRKAGEPRESGFSGPQCSPGPVPTPINVPSPPMGEGLGSNRGCSHTGEEFASKEHCTFVLYSDSRFCFC